MTPVYTAFPDQDVSRRWHAVSTTDVPGLLGTDPVNGLSREEAAVRLRKLGPNSLGTPRREPWWEVLVESLTEPLVLLLIGVGVLYGVLGETRDAVTILFVIVAVAAVEVVNERRANRAIAAMRELSDPTASLLRGGRLLESPAANLVPGDVVLLKAGDRVPADLRLLDAVALRTDESSLTGESVPVAKSAQAVLPVETDLGDRRNMVHAGTIVVAGKGRGVVVATGSATELGRVARLTESVREVRTPLQQQMRQLSGWLLWLALGFSILVPLLGVLVARLPLQEMLLTSLSLAFATIPEELPILITIVIGIGSYQLSRRKAIVKRLRAAETLGTVSVVGTDKTGTLTENRMRVTAILVDEEEREVRSGMMDPPMLRLLEVAILANDAQLASDHHRGRETVFLGDPTDTALLAAAEEASVPVASVRSNVAVLDEYPFDDARKRIGIVYQRDGERWAAVKGAPESVLAICSRRLTTEGAELLDDTGRAEQLATAEAMAAEGQRVIAFADRQMETDEPLEQGKVESGLTLLGFAGLEDPPRPEVPKAVETLQRAGVRVLMLTGDHPATALANAKQVGIPTGRVVTGRELEDLSDDELRELAGRASVFARITPEHKLRLVRALASAGEVVAVTGDGVNDAPALREAAIGIAMGQTGTDVAREAADMVLADDNFATVAFAVREGRKLFENLHKAVRYYLAAKVALIGSSLAAVLLQLPVPFVPVQIIVMELFMDLGASTTFVAERPEGDVMARPPRDPRRPFMDGPMQFGVFAGGFSLAVAVLVAYLWAWGQGLGAASAQTVAFVTWMVGHLALAAHMRSERQPLLRLGPFSNVPYLLWSAGALLLTVLGVNVPILRTALHLAPITPAAWVVAVVAGLVAPSWWEAVKWARRPRDGVTG
jgi:P-type Ca2+ transporter type 2C